MTTEDLDENYEDETPRETRVGGVVHQPDDYEVNDLVCVYDCKQSPDEPSSIMGQSMKITAICLPFFVTEVLSDPSNPIVTLDTRFVNMMRVTPEFVAAQQRISKPAPPEMQTVPSPKKVRTKPQS